MIGGVSYYYFEITPALYFLISYRVIWSFKSYLKLMLKGVKSVKTIRNHAFAFNYAIISGLSTKSLIRLSLLSLVSSKIESWGMFKKNANFSRNVFKVVSRRFF